MIHCAGLVEDGMSPRRIGQEAFGFAKEKLRRNALSLLVRTLDRHLDAARAVLGHG
jgi:hypothetical protein